MTPEDRRVVVAAARRIVELERLRAAGDCPQGAPSPRPIELLETHTDSFNAPTVKLAKRAVARAGVIEVGKLRL